ncbi:hypothetical protein F53441_14170 [Fusarium austroafricanum]|uniref:DUF4419 domain-containing protein n=1 Tax=Fusarium austroafricanum TaxID=2364996 RepID=A0A8H4NC22_9HYPO|nr:hypothetical protein F53441_14170 [Fusarium austroafricanum]
MKHLLWLVGLATASITVQVSRVEPLPFERDGIATSAEDLFRRSCPEEVEDTPYVASLLASSFEALEAGGRSVFPSSDGFVRGAVEAWAKHEHLILRPDEIWFEILAQMNVYMSRHAESLRGLFVEHAEKQKIVVRGFGFEDILKAFGDGIQQRVKTDWLLDWIMPGFSTSTPQDELTATVLMMGLMQHFFEFEGMVVCGIPSVTLLGEREDWVKLQNKIKYLKEFGEEPGKYAQKLEPILKRFVNTWDDGESEEVKKFWEQIVRAKKKWSCGGGANEWSVSGWITGFMHWDRNGRVRGADDYFYDDDDEEKEEEKEEEVQMGIFANDYTVTIDGMSYVPESLDDIAIGYAKAPLKLRDYPLPGADTMTYLLAGNVGVEKKVTPEGVMARPVSGWFMYGPVDTNYVGPDFGSREELWNIAAGIEMCKAKEEADEAKEELEIEEEWKDL